jgi:hypothetical protein
MMLSIAFAIGVPSGALSGDCRPLLIGVTQENERAAPVVVQVGVAHRRAVHDERFIKHVAFALRDVLQLVEEVRQHADVILVDQEELLDALLVPPWCDAGWNGLSDPLSG